MATLAAPSPPASPSLNMRRRSWARKCERYCCSVVSSFPLAVVYGLTTWAVWVQAQIGQNAKAGSYSYPASWLGIFLYLMLNWCYSTAVFTDPGSPLQSNKGGYSSLPTQELARPYTSFTVKSDGGLRFCKKCQTTKPDRTHHCSTCGRCVLKMDHHCPWLAACIGLRNYKPFLLFLVYLAFFCWVCFGVSGNWCWNEFAHDNYVDNLMPVNYIILAVISGIVGLVETGFMIWHVYLASKGQTTIESLEKTRYLSPLRKSMQQHLNSMGAGRHYVDASARRPSLSEQLLETHANVLPGVTRPEEGESPSPTPAQQSLQRNQRTYRDLESQREMDRYNDYLDELDSEKLPNAFDLGWRRNLRHVLGPNAYLWALPICNSTGDGWQWEASPKWVRAREHLAEQRHAQMQRQRDRERAAGWGGGLENAPDDDDTPLEIRRQHLISGAQPPRPGFAPPGPQQQPRWAADARLPHDSRFLKTSDGVATVPQEGRRSPSKADQILGRAPGLYSDALPMQRLQRKDPYDIDDDDEEEYESSSDEEGKGHPSAEARVTPPPPPPRQGSSQQWQGEPGQRPVEMSNWNDLPEDMMGGSRRPSSRNQNQNQRKRPEVEWGGKQA